MHNMMTSCCIVLYRFRHCLLPFGWYIRYVATLAYDVASLNWIVLSTFARQQPEGPCNVWQEKEDKQTRASVLMTEIYSFLSSIVLLLLIGT